MPGMAMSCMGALPKPQRHDPPHVWWKPAWEWQWLGYFVKSVLLAGAANFHGGLPVLKHSVVKIVEFLHSQHSD